MILRRRYTSFLWAASILGAVLALGLTPAGRALPALADGGRILWLTVLPDAASRGLGLLVPDACAEDAHAQEQDVLEFKRVPDESLTTVERDVTGPGTPEPPVPPKPASEVSRTGNIMRIGSDVRVEKDQVVTGDLLALGGDVTVEGHVEGDVVSMGGDVHLAATARVDGDVASIGGELTEEEGAYIGGQRVTARGLQSKSRAERRERARRMADRLSAGTTRIMAGLVGMFVFALIAWGFASLAPGRTSAAVERIRREPGLSMGIGALVWALLVPSLVALALVVAILCITIIGIPLAIAALFGYFVFLALLGAWGYAVSAAALGERVASRRQAAQGLGAPAPIVSLSRKAVLGVLVLAGSGLAGEFLRALFFAPPLQGLGTFITVVARIAIFIAITLGAGALLRNEVVAGTFRRWWHGPKPANAPVDPVPVPAPSAGPYPSAPPAPGYGTQATTPPPTP